MKKVIELIRVSTLGQSADDRAAIPSQRAVNRQTCEKHGLEIVRSIEFSDVSGAEAVLKSPEIALLVDLMKSPEIHGVVSREFSRLMRPERWTDFALLQHFIDTNTMLYTETGLIDLDSDHGRMVGGMGAIMSGIERRQIVRRSWAAKESKRRRGELAQSSIVLPYAVGYESGRFFYKPEAEKVREAFRRFLAGDHCYLRLSQMVGVTPRGMHTIMRNPIWMGWRVIDKKRDLSMSGKYAGENGRQSDRRKVARAPEDVIRVKVIAEPLVSEGDFAAVQRIMDAKSLRHQRERVGGPSRFTYNGFLTCSECGKIVHTRWAKRDYYVCSQVKHCSSKWMARERLDSTLDFLFGQQLTSESFLARLSEAWQAKCVQSDSGAGIQRLTAEIHSLQQKRARIVESFIEGVIAKADRDARLSAIDHSIATSRELLLREEPASIGPGALMEAFRPLHEFPFWTREQKRAVLAALIPEIRVGNYLVESLGVHSSLFRQDESHTAAGFVVAEPSILYIPIGFSAEARC